jgi:hypothetical protein
MPEPPGIAARRDRCPGLDRVTPNNPICTPPLPNPPSDHGEQNGGYVRAVLKRSLALSATENDDLSAYLCVGRRTENARSCRRQGLPTAKALAPLTAGARRTGSSS